MQRHFYRFLRLDNKQKTWTARHDQKMHIISKTLVQKQFVLNIHAINTKSPLILQCLQSSDVLMHINNANYQSGNWSIHAHTRMVGRAQADSNRIAHKQQQRPATIPIDWYKMTTIKETKVKISLMMWCFAYNALSRAHTHYKPYIIHITISHAEQKPIKWHGDHMPWLVMYVVVTRTHSIIISPNG